MLRRVAENPELGERIGSGAHRAYRLALSPPSTVARLLTIYRDEAGTRGAGTPEAA
jgi:hypothetical protein